MLPCDPWLRIQAESVADNWSPEPWPVGSPARPPIVTAGVVASADIWTQAPARIERLHARHASLCEDMEAAAIAQICALHTVPFLTIKDISNNELLRTTDAAYFDGETAGQLGRRAAALTLATLQTIDDRR